MTGSGPVRGRTGPSFVGPWSLVGACLGTVAVLLPAVYGGPSVVLLVTPLAGLVLMLPPVGAPRQVGTGLLASALVWPLVLVALLLLATLS